MRRKGVGGIPVVDETDKAIGSIMIKDVKHLLTASDANRDYRLDSGDLHHSSIKFSHIV
jgi:predicted transcriptional regulator